MSEPSHKGHGVDHKKSKSVAVMGPGGEIGFEGTDAPARVVIISLGIVAGLAAFSFGLMFGYDKFLETQHPTGDLPSPLSPARVLPPAPQLETHPWLDLAGMHAHEKEVLNSSGKDAEGHLHVPIDAAMEAVVSKLNTKPDAPEGLKIPGGQDRVFSHSLAEMPAAYQPVQIQGEILKPAEAVKPVPVQKPAVAPKPAEVQKDVQ